MRTGTLTCDLGKLASGQSVSLTVVWKAPGDPSQPGCADCLVANGTWLVNERKSTNANESFSATETADPDRRVGRRRDERAPAVGGYQLDGCDPADPSTTSLVTDPTLDAESNPVATAFCIPSSFSANAANGLQSTITEPLKGSSNYAHQSEVCIAEPGQDCSDPEYLPQDFSP